MGVNREIKEFDLYIHGDTNLKKGGVKIIHHDDHRIVMSFYIANLICEKSNKIDDKSSVKTSYPSFLSISHITLINFLEKKSENSKKPN